MGKIIKMSPELANKIAAGEVVEKPLSVVKELVENSIDANSNDIKIYLKNSGLTYISIIDNGDGMDKDDVLMAFIPHATSKIKTEQDLYRILTLGFRGEAIASIATVSTMTITSSQTGESGYTCKYKAGIKVSDSLANHNKGTTITVENLFVNTPARLKYIKSEKSELASIIYFLNRIALAYKDIRFSLYNDDKLIFKTTGSNNSTNLIGEIYGLKECKAILETSYVKDGYKANLLFLKPECYRSNKLEITLIVNGRYVRNYNITNAVSSAYDNMLPIGKHPIAVLYLDIDPLLVDCNVHPNKMEIKLANEEQICSDIKNAIRSKLTEETLIPNRTRENFKYEAFEKTTIFDNDIEFESKPKLESKPIVNEITYEDSYILPKVNVIKPEVKEETKVKEVKAIEKPVEKKLPYMEYVGQIFGTYLIFQNDKNMYLMDQHAAAERINFEYYYELLGNSNQPKTDLLIPFNLTLTQSEAIYVLNNLDKFESIGFTLDEIGERDFVIRTVPLWAKLDKFSDICYEIISKMIENDKVDVKYFREDIAASISCKASIKANRFLRKDEIDSLILGLNKCKNPFTCPHGRPTIITISEDELKKMFERIQK